MDFQLWIDFHPRAERSQVWRSQIWLAIFISATTFWFVRICYSVGDAGPGKSITNKWIIRVSGYSFDWFVAPAGSNWKDFSNFCGPTLLAGSASWFSLLFSLITQHAAADCKLSLPDSPAHSPYWLSRQVQPVGSACKFSLLAQPASSAYWLSLRGQPTGSACKFSLLAQPASSAYWLSLQVQPTGSVCKVSLLIQFVGSAKWSIRLAERPFFHFTDSQSTIMNKLILTRQYI